MNDIKLSEFDILGFFDIDDNTFIEEFVTPLGNGKFLSRNESYYKERTCEECSKLREKCKQILNSKNLSYKKQFIVFEYMLNCSAKVFYTQLKNKVANKENQYELAKKCFEEDCENLICTLTNNKINLSEMILPGGEESTEKRFIELDNKALLLMFCSQLPLTGNSKVILTGLGGILLGPFIKTIHGCDYAVAPLSAYKGAKELLAENKASLKDYLAEPKILDSDSEFVFLDDNVGTGGTMRMLVKMLQEEGKSCRCGAAQYNWINYNKVETGEKTIDRFKPDDIDFLTKFNYPGIHLLEHAIIEHLIPYGGDDYIAYLKSKSYRRDNASDLETLANKGERYANASGVFFTDDEINASKGEKRVNKTSLELIKKIDEKIKGTEPTY